jgi:hypothetical protein
MNRTKESAFWVLAAGSLWPTMALAEETTAAGGGYAASDFVWFTVIGLVLAYGVYDSFFKTP